ncbi:hypothetical protein FACI_IFERC00001G1780 [Ferroplasma acidarmanus Fer1]|uniref:Uncharacterized protein n=1 Tax=Ferroplasma acidarmanus Fer1 TaxID=333146 RepID=S0ARD3_FERAC|nr:hypothetical protein FACI_IFERC00001G1780 [Ferroplasma acidarmanus Fer1]
MVFDQQNFQNVVLLSIFDNTKICNNIYFTKSLYSIEYRAYELNSVQCGMENYTLSNVPPL